MSSVFVMGGSRGIGRAIATECERRGHRVTIASRATCDVTSYPDVERTLTAFGELDALVVSAGTATSSLLAIADPADLRRVVETNTLGPLHCARAALPIMLQQRRGLILFIGSVATSRPARGQAGYAASKSGVEALTRAIAVEYGRKGIRALCLRPGAVDTDMLKATRALADDELTARIPLRRIASAEEIARTAATLLGDDASYMNGAMIDVDGGYAAG
jgi:3-oxoacyl-[acyl-carrier protein] reductase